VTAVVSFHPGQSATPEEISSTLGGLSRFKQPKHYVFVPVVQRAPNGKADYKWAKETAKRSV
ncbi:MAG TPA: acyl-CoA synthetase, partial [Acidimicrobiia bacterium]|nr:acyl-CoA synthetase [Acidimicrobiia bacterium]